MITREKYVVKKGTSYLMIVHHPISNKNIHAWVNEIQYATHFENIITAQANSTMNGGKVYSVNYILQEQH